MLVPLTRRVAISSNLNSYRRGFLGPECVVGSILVALVLAVAFLQDTATADSYLLISDQSSPPYHMQPIKSVVKLSGSVAQALKQGLPIVALESTVITHGGLGYPRNLETAKALEGEITSQGAVPATIAVMNGAIHVGLSPDQLEYLSQTTQAVKCSKRDIGTAVAMRLTCSTTVAATMFASHLVGIHIFATGGLGGVHRGAFGHPAASMDVSADLTELGRTPVLVVCAGVKSILDVKGTLEYLETLGVPVASYVTDMFPQFFTANPNLKSPSKVNTIHEAASVWRTNRELATGTGMVLAVPNPDPVPGIEKIVTKALQETSSVQGKDVTPAVLKRVAELSEGKSIVSNIRLLKNNAKIAAQLAVAYHE